MTLFACKTHSQVLGPAGLRCPNCGTIRVVKSVNPNEVGVARTSVALVIETEEMAELDRDISQYLAVKAAKPAAE